MIVSGITLAMNYTAHTSMAFKSVERIMRDVNFGWLIRYIHMNGASMFFIAVFIHIFRGLYFGSYKAPREILWMLGVVILLLMMATAFMGYVLPWGQMSFWGATVITNLFSAFPIIGDHIVTWLWGGFSVDNPTLNRFFALHYLLPFVLLGVVFLHVAAVHVHGSNNPVGIDIKGPQDSLPFHPYFTMKDTFGLGVFMIIFAAFVFFAPNYMGHPDNYIPANPLVTPAHIVPEWYFLPFYAILRAVPDKLGGVLAMFGAIAVLFVVPWLDTSKVRSANYRPLYRQFFWVLVVACILLGYAGVAAGRRRLADHRPRRVDLLLRSLPDHPAAARQGGASPAASQQHQRTRSDGWWPHGDRGSRQADGEGLMRALKKVILAAAIGLGLTGSAFAAGEAHIALPKQEWSHSGIFGTFDRASLQRGFQVYKEVCSTCHAMSLVSYRNLQALGFSR